MELAVIIFLCENYFSARFIIFSLYLINSFTNLHEFIYVPMIYFNKKFSALPGESNSHKDATVHPGAKILL